LIETSRLARALENVCQARMILIARVDISTAKDGLFMVASRPFASKGWTFVTRMLDPQPKRAVISDILCSS